MISHMHDASRQDSQSQTESNERTFAEVTANNVDLQTLQRTATEEIIADLEARDQTFTVNTILSYPISMECLRSFLRRYLAGKPVVRRRQMPAVS